MLRTFKNLLKNERLYFNIYPFLYQENKYLPEFKVRRYTINWDPQLNSYQKIPSTH